MSNPVCPLYLASKEDPDFPFLKTPLKTYSYSDLEKQTLFLMHNLSHAPKESVFASQSEDFFFNTALLFALARLGHIYFPLSPKLPEKSVKMFLNQAKVAHVFTHPELGEKEYDTQAPPQINSLKPLTYLLTSGSSSTPKICVHSFSNHSISAQTSNDHLNFHKGKTWLCSLPLYHVSGLSLIFRSILARATLIQKSDKIEKTLQKEKVTHLSLVPTQLKRLIKNKIPRSVECILLGGAPIHPEFLKEAQEKSLPLYSTYGLTEMASQVFTYCPKHKKMILLPKREFKLGPDQELLLKGPTLFLGYLLENQIKSSLDQDGFYPTKDLAKFENGNFVFLGRKDNLFISGGENIQPEEIEKILLSHPDVEEAIVLPVPDEEFGHRPVAFIKALSLITQASLELFIKPYLPKYKHPVDYRPLNYKGLKPSRKRLFSKLSKKR